MSDDGWDDGGDDDGWDDDDDGGDDQNGGWGGDIVDEPEELTWDVQCENLLETGNMNKNDPELALKNYLDCIELEEKNSKENNEVKFRFTALEKVVNLQYNMKKLDDMTKSYDKLLKLAQLPGVTPNELNRAIRGILNLVQTANDNDVLTQMYEKTLDFFKKQKNDRFWFEYAMRLCKTYFDKNDLKSCELLLDDLHSSCKDKNGNDDKTKGAQLLEVYAIRIQVVTARNDSVALNELFERTKMLSADINDPKSMSVIKECWGKMYGSTNRWNDAYQTFFDAFRSYNEIGSPNTKQCLKYVVLASLLSTEGVNPFATQEAGVYRQDKEIIPMANVLEAFHNDDVKLFEKTIETSGKDHILNDQFIKENMPQLKVKLRSRYLVKLIKPYKRVKLEWLCRHLNAKIDEVENLVVNLILDGTIKGRIDQIHNLLDLDFLGTTDDIYNALDSWMKTVKQLQGNLGNRSTRLGTGRGPMMGFMDDFYDDYGYDDFGGGFGGIFGGLGLFGGGFY